MDTNVEQNNKNDGSIELVLTKWENKSEYGFLDPFDNLERILK